MAYPDQYGMYAVLAARDPPQQGTAGGPETRAEVRLLSELLGQLLQVTGLLQLVTWTITTSNMDYYN